MYKFELEKGSKKYDCPACSQKRFVRYVNIETSDHLSYDVGRCDREGKCGYHKKPKEYFADNPNKSNVGVYVGTCRNEGISNHNLPNKNRSQQSTDAQTTKKNADHIDKRYLLRTLANYEQNAFVQFLINLFPNSFDEVEKVVKNYKIGTTKDGKTIFWQIDKKHRIRTGKIIAYDCLIGERRKDIFPNWIHAELKKKNLLKQDFNLKQCFFGEHLLQKYPGKTVAIVEAEKTAVICSIIFPEILWLAVGAKGYLNAQRIQIFADRKILLFPDADAFSDWKEKAILAQRNGFNVRVSNLIEINGTASEKENGFDLADYLIDEQIDRLEEQNNFADFYNAKLEKVLENEELLADLDKILDEQKSILIIDGKVTENEAESQVTRAENVRNVVLSL